MTSQHENQYEHRPDHKCGRAVQRDPYSGAETDGGEDAADGPGTTHRARGDAGSDDRRTFLAAAHDATPNSAVTIG